MKTVVCLKVTPKVDQIKFDEVKKTIMREGVENEINDADKNALELALTLKEKQGGTVTILSMGPPSFEPQLKLAVAMGADEAVLLSDRAFGGADTYATSRVIAAGIKKLEPYDLVLCGEASADGSTEQTPPSVAAWLGIPVVSYLNSAEVKDGRATVKRAVGGGSETVDVAMPFLGSVELGCNTPRFPDFRRKRWAEKEYKMTVWNIADLGFQPGQVGLAGSLTEVTGLKSMATRFRHHEMIAGDPKEVAAKLHQIITTLTG